MRPIGVMLLVVAALPAATAVAQQTKLLPIPPALRLNPRARVLRAGATSTAVPSGAASVSLRPGEFVAARTTAAGPVRRPGDTVPDRFVLPVQLLGVDAAGEVLDARPTVAVEGGGLSPSAGENAFAGSVLVGLEAAAPGPRRELGRSVRLLITSSTGTVAPAQVALDHTSLPYVAVRLAAPPGPAEAVVLRIRTDFDPAPMEVSVPVLRSTLTVKPTPERIAGYGLEAATIGVRAEPAPAGGSVLLTARRGTIEPARVPLDASGIGTATLRSVGTGRDTVEAQGQSFRAASGVVDYVFPKGFLIAALVGALLGGFIREWLATRSGKGRVGLGTFALGWLVATVVGVIIVAAWKVGIDITDLKVPVEAGEAVVGVVAALGAILGLNWLAKKGAPAPPAPQEE